MRTKKQKPENDEAVKNLLDPSKLGTDSTIDSAPETGKRVGVAWYVKDDGTYDVSHMRHSTREQLRSFLADPIVQKQLGLTQKESSEVAEVFSPEWCGTIYDGLSSVMAATASKLYKIPLAATQDILAFNEAEKEKLAGPTAAVINKYASGWLVRFKEEIALAVLVGSITLAKLTMLRVMAASYKTERPEPQRAKKEPATVVTLPEKPNGEVVLESE